MSTNGQLVFTDVDKITFKGVGNTSNAVVDTVTGKIGVGIDSPDANLHVLGNTYVSTNLELGGTLIMGTVNVVARHDLESVTATGNTTPLTVEFQNADTSLVASGNVEVGTANLFVDTTNSRVGIGDAAPAELVHIRGPNPQMLIEGATNENANIDFSSGPSYRNRVHRIQTEHYALSGFATSNKMNFRVNAGGEDTPSIRMTIRGDGNVGIGTSTPGQKLSIYTGSTSTPALSFDRYSTDNYRTDIYQDANGPDFRVGYGSYTPSRVLYLKRYSNGNKGIEIDARLLTFKQGNRPGTNTNTHGIKMENTDNTNYWNLFISNNDHFRFVYNGVGKGYVDQSDPEAQMNFTGQHRTFIKDVPFSQAGDLEGLIVSANQNKYIKMSGGIETGSNAITMNETLPVVSLSVTAKDKKCFGVISGSEDPESRTEQYGVFGSTFEKEKGDTRVYINSVGEGAIWVTNINGPLESGDYITTSNVAGYGQKQDSEFLANYTVAKITMDCDFEPVTQPVQVIKKDEDGENVLDEHSQIQWEDHPTETEKTYKIRYLDANGNITDETNAVHTAAFVGCTYHCG
tara:strand:+ start:1362 stop:3080 length:1719 start_codon:yes stop_codon:yes gene_type:complete